MFVRLTDVDQEKLLTGGEALLQRRRHDFERKGFGHACQSIVFRFFAE